MTIETLRNDIDALDRQIVELLATRQRLAMAIGRLKAGNGLPVRVPERERALLARIRHQAAGHRLDVATVERLYGLILETSRRAQLADRLAGEEGAA
jgi:chorismate mutase